MMRRFNDFMHYIYTLGFGIGVMSLYVLLYGGILMYLTTFGVNAGHPIFIITMLFGGFGFMSVGIGCYSVLLSHYRLLSEELRELELRHEKKKKR